MTRSAKHAVFFLATTISLLVVAAGMANPTLEITAPESGERLQRGSQVRVELRVEGFPDRELRPLSDGFGLSVRPVDLGEPIASVGFTSLTQESFRWVDRERGIASVFLVWEVPPAASPGEYELEARVWIGGIRPYPLSAKQRVGVGPGEVVPGELGVDIELPADTSEVGVGQRVLLRLLVEGLPPERTAGEGDRLRLWLSTLEEDDPEGAGQRYLHDDRSLADPEVDFRWVDREEGQAQIEHRLVMPAEIGNFRPGEGGLGFVLEVELEVEGFAQPVSDRVELALVRRPITVTREVRAFLEGCDGPVVVLPGFPVWVRLRVQMHEEVPAIIVQERMPQDWTPRLAEEAQEAGNARVVPVNCDLGAGTGPCWTLLPVNGAFAAGTEIELIYSLRVPSGEGEQELTLSGRFQTIGTAGEIMTGAIENTQLQVRQRLPVLVAVALLDPVLMQIEPDDFDREDYLQRYTISKEQYEMAAGLVGEPIPGARELLSPEVFLQLAWYYSTGRPVVECP